mmetsp:Transcript_23565/g.42027  ORF Transcript_23565/g.42027 Transcript_23565/m.42027 type:complete len:207 (-) Transcript_23565:108-728(-)
MRVNDAREYDRENDASVHNDCEHDCAKVADRLEDIELPHGRADGEDHDVEVHLRMPHHELDELLELLGVDKGNEREDHRKGVDREHHVEWREVLVPREHAALPLARKRVEHKEEAQQHHATDRAGPRFGCPDRVCAELHVLRRHHEDSDPEANHEAHDVVVSGVRLVAEELAHEHDGYKFEAFEEHLSGERDVLEGLVLGPARKHV